LFDADVDSFFTGKKRQVPVEIGPPGQLHRQYPFVVKIFSATFGQTDPSIGICTVGIGVGIGVGVATGVGVGSTGLKTGFRSGFGAAFTATPLFQTSFVPDLTQVNFFPADIDVAPTFVHFAPALAAAKDGAEISEIDRTKARRIRARVMPIRYQSAIPN
jgi:hypothetical protein